MRMMPKNRLGKWAVGLSVVFVVLIRGFVLLVAMGLADFDTGHAWDWTVGIAAPIELVAFALSILAIRKEKAVLTYCALALGILAALFVLTHSLLIQD